MDRDNLGLVILIIGAILALTGIFYSTRPGPKNMFGLQKDAERGCLFGLVGFTAVVVGGIIMLL